MDPNLFHVDGERLFEVLVAIVVLSFFVERALSLVFEHRFYIKWFGDKGAKELISFTVAFLICWRWDFDALSVVLVQETMQPWGMAMTAAIIAGGSKASLKFFHEVVGAMSTTEKKRREITVSSAATKPVTP